MRYGILAVVLTAILTWACDVAIPSADTASPPDMHRTPTYADLATGDLGGEDCQVNSYCLTLHPEAFCAKVSCASPGKCIVSPACGRLGQPCCAGLTCSGGTYCDGVACLGCAP